MKREKFYEVEAKCGHVGRGYYVDKCFGVLAHSAKEAAEMVRNFPRVKHHWKDAIGYVEEVNEERYLELRQDNLNDPYMLCKSRREQKQTCEAELMESRIHAPEPFEVYREQSRKPVYDGKKIVRNPKRYMRFNADFEMEFAC